MKTFITALLLTISALSVFGQGTAVRSKDGVATNLTARSTVTNLPAAITDTSGFIRIFVPPTNSVAGQPLYQEWWTLASTGTNRQFIFNKGYNVGPAGVLDTNHIGFQETHESGWDPFPPSNIEQWEQYWTVYPRSNGTPYRIFSNTVRDASGESRFNTDVFSLSDKTSNIPSFTVSLDLATHASTVTVLGQIITITNAQSNGDISLRGGSIVSTVPTGYASSSVYSGVDFANGLGHRPHYYTESFGTSKAWKIVGFTNFSAGTFGLRTPPGTSIATPKVWADAIEATNDSALVLTGGGVSLSLNSGSIVAEAGHSFSGSGALLTALNASEIASGTVPTARLGSGTANNTTFLRGDQTWQVGTGGSGDTNAISYPDMSNFARTRTTSTDLPVGELRYTNGNPALVITNAGPDSEGFAIKSSTGMDAFRFVSNGDMRIASPNAMYLYYNDSVLWADLQNNLHRLRDTNGNVIIDFSSATAGVDITTLNPTTVNTAAINLGENSGAIALDAALSADGKSSGITRAGTAGATLAFGDLVVLDVTDSRWELADANSASGADGDARGMIGICVLAAAADGDPTTILLQGVVRADAAFPSFTVNAPIYVSETAGDITATSPTTSGNVVRILGAATTADEIYFSPDRVWTIYVP